jgi:ParB family transcriptional regulator, chromosome partitioning protein
MNQTQVSQAPQLDPRLLLVDVNVRHSTSADKDLVASVREVGVLQPINAVRTADGQVRVRYGHRRTLAAIQADLPTVPVLIVADEGTTDAAQVERLVTQWAENQHRVGLSNAEQADVIGQLAAFGVSAAQIAKRTKTPRATVNAALTVMGSELARHAAARYDWLDLTQAAVVAEVEDDPEAVKALIAAAKTGQFDHVAQRIRDKRAEQARIEVKTEELRAQGITVVDRPEYNDTTTRSLRDLVDAEGNEVDAEQHRACPGHAVYLTEETEWIKLSEVPNLPDGWDWLADDWTDSEQHEREEDPEVQAYGLGAVPVCQDYAAHAHQIQTYGRPVGNQADQLSEADKGHARAERGDVIASNKAWKSATTVRREFVTRLLTRKSAPKGAVAYVAHELAQGEHAQRRAMEDGHTTACELLGVEVETGSYGYRSGRTKLAEQLAQASDGRAQVITLGLILAAQEAATNTNSWRYVHADTSRYLTFLAERGYPLAEVEHRACGRTVLPENPDETPDAESTR